MLMRRFHVPMTGVLGFSLLVVGLHSALGQEAPPTENKGMKAPVLTAIDLGPEIEGMQGRQLRMRLVTLGPGGVIAVHSHKDRPTVVHLLHGTWTEFREGGYVKEHRQGESWSEGGTTTHWTENRGSEPSAALVVDVFRKP